MRDSREVAAGRFTCDLPGYGSKEGGSHLVWTTWVSRDPSYELQVYIVEQAGSPGTRMEGSISSL